MASAKRIKRALPWAIPVIAVVAAVAVLWPRGDPPAREPVHYARVARDAGAPGSRHRPKTQKELPTTSAEIWLENLDGTISELERLVAARPEIVENVKKLSSAHYLRGRFRGDLDEMNEGIEHATKCMKLAPDDATCTLMRAEQAQSLHRFEEARLDLEAAKKHGADPARVADLEAELDWNDGQYERAIAQIKKARAERPSTATWVREAQLHYDLDEVDEGEAAFERAEDLITDTSPFPVAHLNVQRGIQLVLRGRLEEACAFFREAVARMPTYVAANEHLAEALHGLGRDEEATTIYEKVVRISDDPEFLHALAELYAKRGQSENAKKLEERAKKGYDELLAKYPEAMYWHASEFFMSVGEKKKALSLLQKNVELRPNSTSLVALARAQLANGLASDARASIEKALGMPIKSASLFFTASLVHRKSGDAAKADELLLAAKKMNPRIELDEPADD